MTEPTKISVNKSLTGHRPPQDPRTLTQQDVVQKMIEDYLADTGGKFPKNHSSRVVKIVSHNDQKFGNTDPFYNAEVNKARMYNGGVILEPKKWVYAFVEIFPQQTSKTVENFLVNIDAKLKSDSENYLLLPRLDVTNFEKRFQGQLQVGQELVVGFENYSTQSKLKIIKTKSQKTEEMILKHPGTITVGGGDE